VRATKIARRYARALSDVCAESKNHAVIGKQLETFVETWTSSAELQDVLRSPVVPLSDKREILTRLFAKFLFAPTTRNFLLVLLEGGRIGEVEAVAEAFRELMDEASARSRAVVVTPAPLERADLQRIQAALQRLTGRTVLLEARMDPTLIGGARVQLGHLEMDGTIRTHLDTLRGRLIA
jgi:F-type H+-transporting ATPase subunit delta